MYVSDFLYLENWQNDAVLYVIYRTILEIYVILIAPMQVPGLKD